MTAVVGILNQQAVAVAADSAVTVRGANGIKIFNQANKIFTLSKRHPIGVMIYNSATLMGVPWETIIKSYRHQLGGKELTSVEEYQSDFINYLHKNDFFMSESDQLSYYEDFFYSSLISIKNDVSKENPEILGLGGLEQDKAFSKLLLGFLKKFTQLIESQSEKCEEFKNVSNETILDFIEDPLKKSVVLFFSKDYKPSKALFTALKKFFSTIIKHKGTLDNFTGLVFTGFGSEDIYPKLIPINISLVVKDRLKYFVDRRNSATISYDMNSAIRPFAQTDVIDTILSGVAPELESTFMENFELFFSKYNELLIKEVDNPDVETLIRRINVPELISNYADQIAQVKTTYHIKPLMNAVSFLSKEDLAEMAESLIYLTYLKRRITFAEESVGGPVDVAVISKGDGFIWLKRKHYFKPELNGHFFENYFNFEG